MCDLDKIRYKFAGFKSPDDKWLYLIELSKQSVPIDPDLKRDQFIVDGCSTVLFLVPSYDNGKLYFDMDLGVRRLPSISLGLALLLKKVYSGMTPKEILAFDINFFNEIGLNIGMTPTRANGFASMLKLIRRYADVFSKMSD